MMIVAVIGQMRTGTSEVARLLHHNGVSMGQMMMMPLPGFSEADYEDAEFIQITTQAATQRSEPKQEVFEGYIARRRRAFEALRGLYGEHATGYGLKSHLLACHWKTWVRACAAQGERLFVVETSRDEVETSDSLGRCTSHAIEAFRDSYSEAIFSEQFRIATALEGIESDVKIQCNQSAESKLAALRSAGLPIRG